MDSERTTPRVFIAEDTPFFRVGLSNIVEEAGCEVVRASGEDDLCGQLEQAGGPLALIMLPLYPNPERALDGVAAIRKRGWLSRVPILAISPLDQSGMDLARMRLLGVTGLVDKRALPEHVRFRVGQVVYHGVEGRRYERAPCCIPVDVEVEGEVRTEYAISLSIAGVGLASSRKIRPNTPVKLRFVLDVPDHDIIEAEGRAVHMRPATREDADYEVGVFFYPLSTRAAGAIQGEVSRLLDAWAAVSQMDLEKDEPEA